MSYRDLHFFSQEKLFTNSLSLNIFILLLRNKIEVSPTANEHKKKNPQGFNDWAMTKKDTRLLKRVKIYLDHEGSGV